MSILGLLEAVLLSPLIIVVAAFYFGLFLLFKWVRSLFTNKTNSLIKQNIFISIIIAGYVMIPVLTYWEIYHPFGKEKSGAYNYYNLIVNPEIRWMQFVFFIFICLTAFRVESFSFVKNYKRYIMITILACLVLVLAVYLSDQYKNYCYNTKFKGKDYTLKEWDKFIDRTKLLFDFFIELMMLVFIISLGINGRGNSKEKFNYWPIAAMIVFFALSTYINWRFYSLSTADWWIWLEKVGGMG